MGIKTNTTAIFRLVDDCVVCDAPMSPERAKTCSNYCLKILESKTQNVEKARALYVDKQIENQASDHFLLVMRPPGMCSK